ncbi:hypothetical protein QJS66_19285 [Kocuria rhizophila]|nr:hypothetical protein QJS66_19285 [Kocuria rhizophila]
MTTELKGPGHPLPSLQPRPPDGAGDPPNPRGARYLIPEEPCSGTRG